MRNLLLDAAATAAKVNEILSQIVGPIMIAIGGAMSIYIVILAVQYAKSENDNKRAEAKTRMVNCFIGIVIIAVLAALCMGMNWEGIVRSMYGYY